MVQNSLLLDSLKITIPLVEIDCKIPNKSVFDILGTPGYMVIFGPAVFYIFDHMVNFWALWFSIFRSFSFGLRYQLGIFWHTHSVFTSSAASLRWHRLAVSPSPHPPEPCLTVLSSFQLEFPESIVESALDSPLDELVAAHLRACWAVAKNDFLEAYKCQALAGKNRF